MCRFTSRQKKSGEERNLLASLRGTKEGFPEGGESRCRGR